jgi:hypothetical protein
MGKHLFARFLLLFLVLNTGCAALYGLKNPASRSPEEIIKTAKRYGIPAEDSYQIDTAYRAMLRQWDTVQYQVAIKNHTQPLQALYYTADGTLETFHVNCYAGGFPNLRWNRTRAFDVFPPRQQAPLDSLVPLTVQLQYLQPLIGTTTTRPLPHERVIIVYWTHFMGRQSKRFIRLIQRNAALAPDPQKVKILYVNVDHLFLDIRL